MNGTASQGPAAGKGHILVVEDDQTLGEALCQVLRGAGYSATLATEFRTALEILEAEQPLDLLLVDIVMPDSVNGIALSRMARLRRRELKVIYLTGYDIPGCRSRGAGADSAQAGRQPGTARGDRPIAGGVAGLVRRLSTPRRAACRAFA